MNRPTVCLWLALMLLGSAVAVPPVRVPQPAPRMGQGGATNVRAIQDARPTLDLLVTVRLLSDLLTRQEITPDGQARRELDLLLRPLLTAPALRPTDAAALDTALRAALTPSQALTLARARTAAQARAQAFMDRARFAALDGPINLTLIRYGLMVPGGQDTVKLALEPNFNPYAQAGDNAEVLGGLLALLKG
ncbi:hypothetical protein [Deinococcus arenicola]|uniref:DUF1400 domain-containing protein n=1 Tax=Deinococcus arenicola TaxID=2994950 RepID=A0ABU4DRC0_9DEIO|nr:hypothetical protein [Deinococcus sp. ZS9-10]MDV6374512.1 hypothetical protein [Deinococcus sp. ZS9-10]